MSVSTYVNAKMVSSYIIPDDDYTHCCRIFYESFAMTDLVSNMTLFIRGLTEPLTEKTSDRLPYTFNDREYFFLVNMKLEN